MKSKIWLLVFISAVVGVFMVPPPERAAADGNFRFTPGFGAECALGRITGCSVFRKFGYNPDIDTTGLPETVCSYSNSEAPLFTTASTVVVVSSDGADTNIASATGTRSIFVSGVDGNGTLTTETVSLDGVNEVTLANEYMFINSAYGVDTGTNYKNVGTITLKYGDLAQTIAEIPINQGQTQCFHAYVPAGHVWLIDNITASQDKKGSGAVTLNYEIMLDGTNTWRNVFPVGLSAAGTSKIQTMVGNSRYFALPPKTRVTAHVEDATANDNQVTASAAGFLLDLSKFKF